MVMRFASVVEDAPRRVLLKTELRLHTDAKKHLIPDVILAQEFKEVTFHRHLGLLTDAEAIMSQNAL